eukprot:1262088-Prorocentrum_lima.AAC.1
MHGKQRCSIKERNCPMLLRQHLQRRLSRHRATLAETAQEPPLRKEAKGEARIDPTQRILRRLCANSGLEALASTSLAPSCIPSLEEDPLGSPDSTGFAGAVTVHRCTGFVGATDEAEARGGVYEALQSTAM